MTTDRALAKDRSFMRMAYAAAELATCPRLSVGAVIVDPDGYVVASGRNGAPVGEVHCQHDVSEPCQISSHAELNACLFAGRRAALGGTMFVTHSPCWACAAAILNVGLVRVVYAESYRDSAGIERLESAGIDVRRLGDG